MTMTQPIGRRYCTSQVHEKGNPRAFLCFSLRQLVPSSGFNYRSSNFNVKIMRELTQQHSRLLDDLRKLSRESQIGMFQWPMQEKAKIVGRRQLNMGWDMWTLSGIYDTQSRLHHKTDCCLLNFQLSVAITSRVYVVWLWRATASGVSAPALLPKWKCQTDFLSSRLE